MNTQFRIGTNVPGWGAAMSLQCVARTCRKQPPKLGGGSDAGGRRYVV